MKLGNYGIAETYKEGITLRSAGLLLGKQSMPVPSVTWSADIHIVTIDEYLHIMMTYVTYQLSWPGSIRVLL